jgi:hypothetical protein
LFNFSNEKGAATYRKGGLGVRKIAYSHLAMGIFFLFLSIGGIFRYVRANQEIVLLGLTIMVTVCVGIYCWAEATGEKAEKFTDRAIAWKDGLVAEENVRGLLETLPNNYYVVDDFVTKKGTIDHIVVGPKGILAIETKSHKGVVAKDGEKLLRDGQPFETDFIKQAWALSYCVRDLLSVNGVCVLKPQPVIVFTDADVQVKGKVRGVQIVGIKDLHSFLEGLPVWMSYRLSKAIIDCLWSFMNVEV